MSRILVLSLVALQLGVAQTSVLTRSFDNSRTGWNQQEMKLTPARLAAQGMKSISLVPGTDDPRIEAQPLYVPGIVMSDGNKHDVIYVFTMSNNIWAFDADTGAEIWAQPSFLAQPFLPKWGDAVDSKNINRSFGILSTPVIDPESGVMYVVDWDTNDAAHQNRSLHVNALRLKDGKPVTSKPPLLIAASVTNASGQTISLNQVQKQRAALLLFPLHGKPAAGGHKTLYVAFTGTEQPSNNGDPTKSLHGWVVAFDVDAWKQAGQWTPTPNSFGGGIWMASQGPAADASGNVYLITGNGGYAVKNGANVDVGIGTTDFPEGFIRLSHVTNAQGSSLALADWFIPFKDSIRKSWSNAEVAPFPSTFDYKDQDLGSAGALLPPGTTLVVGAGKDGILYVMDRGHMGKRAGDFSVLKAPPAFLTFDPDPKVPAYQHATPTSNQDYKPMPGVKTHHLHGTPLYMNTSHGPMLFAWGENGTLRGYSLDASGRVKLLTHGTDVASADLADPANNTLGGMPGGMLTGSSSGTQNGIVWATAPVTGDANAKVVPAAIRAYDASAFGPGDLNPDGVPKLKKIWENTGFMFSKFCPPVVADGRVIVATYQGRVDVYTLKPAAGPAHVVKKHD